MKPHNALITIDGISRHFTWMRRCESFPLKIIILMMANIRFLVKSLKSSLLVCEKEQFLIVRRMMNVFDIDKHRLAGRNLII